MSMMCSKDVLQSMITVLRVRLMDIKSLQRHLSIKAEKLTVQASQKQYMQLQGQTTKTGLVFVRSDIKSEPKKKKKTKTVRPPLELEAI